LLDFQVARILTAVAPDTEERVRRILTGHELLFVNDLHAAEAALEKVRIELILIGARFDQSRMFDLLDYIRGHAEHKKIPIVATIIAPTKMSKETVAGIKHTTKLYGASLFINLNDFTDDEMQNARLRIVVDALILPPEKIPVVVKHLSPNT
jgi:hypothetical protein